MPCLEELHVNEHDWCEIRTIRPGGAAAALLRILGGRCRIPINISKSLNYIVFSPSRVFMACRFSMAPLLLTPIVRAHQEIPKTLTDPYVSWRLF